MKYLKLFKTEAEYNTATITLPNISYIRETGNVYYNAKHAVDRSINAPLMNIAVANEWAKESENYLTYEEAARVTSIAKQDLIDYNVVSLLELKYFTGISTVDIKGVTTVERIYIKQGVRWLFDFTTTALNYIKLSDDVSSLYSNNDSAPAISQYAKYKAESGNVVPNTYIIGGKSTTNFGLKYGYVTSKVNSVVVPYDSEVIASSLGISLSTCGNVYVPDELVDGYKETYANYASKFLPISQFTDPYPDF